MIDAKRTAGDRADSFRLMGEDAGGGRGLRGRYLPLVLMFTLCLVGTALLVRAVAVDYGARDVSRTAQERLRLISATLSTSIERFRYLPDVVARSREIEDLFRQNATADQRLAANQLLERISNASGALALFVADTSGLTIASSNFGSPGSFVGQNYSYRPYFQDALAKGFGNYYAVGATTGQPGYFLATPITLDGAVVGVAIVKIDLLPVEQQWRDAGETVAMNDSQGVIFLSSNPQWRYTAIGAVSTGQLKQLTDERRYGDAAIGLAGIALKNEGGYEKASFGGAEAPQRLRATAAFGPDGWVLNYFADLGSVERLANTLALAAVLALMLAVAGLMILLQRRKAQAVARRALEVLEARVDERTSELRETNARLALEIAERQEAERQLDVTRTNLTQAEKLAAIGQSFAGLAHEINQPLAALQTYIASTRLLVERRKLDVAKGNFDTMGDIVSRVSELTNQLKRLARRKDEDFVELDLALQVRRTLTLLKFRFADLGIAAIDRLQEGVVVHGSGTQLDQVVLNLLNNAVDAVRNVENPRIEVAIETGDGACALTISDNGAGIDPAEQTRLFEPFHTTKAAGEGLGLGLATANRIVTDHHGRLSYFPSPLGGAGFRIELPRVEMDRGRLRA
ncbi:ATP-binding protein [Rhizobium cremeum]|uniref:ATP-binding protein n=1 Tax=Rhizobium cremeum TaxID=2813827 RepID=UPI001FD041D7|nr:ATP-binding protein [Rhizobium cremeum]